MFVSVPMAARALLLFGAGGGLFLARPAAAAGGGGGSLPASECAAEEACGAEEVEDMWSAMQLRQQSQVEATGSASSVSFEGRATKANQTEGAVITTAAVLSAGYTVAALTATVLGEKAIEGVMDSVWGQLTGSDDFESAVGSMGLPLTVGVINNLNHNVTYSDFKVRDGNAWGHPALKSSFAPGEMLEWFMYAKTTGVAATMLFEDGKTSWSVAVARYRTGNWATGCDKMRCQVVRTHDMEAPYGDLCSTHGPGIKVKGGYELVLLLNEAGL